MAYGINVCFIIFSFVTIASANDLETIRQFLEEKIVVNEESRLVLNSFAESANISELEGTSQSSDARWLEQYRLNAVCDVLPKSLLYDGSSIDYLSDIYAEILTFGDPVPTKEMDLDKRLSAVASKIKRPLSDEERAMGIETTSFSPQYYEYRRYRNLNTFLHSITETSFEALKRTDPTWRNDQNLELAKLRILNEWASAGHKDAIDESLSELRRLRASDPILRWRDHVNRFDDNQLRLELASPVARTTSLPHFSSWRRNEDWVNLSLDSDGRRFSLQIKLVRLLRPWLDEHVFFRPDWIWREGSVRGPISNGGEEGAELLGVAPLFPQFIVLARRVSFENWDGLSQFSSLNLYDPDAPFIIGRICRIVPLCPIN